jgi:hypothetical protein
MRFATQSAAEAPRKCRRRDTPRRESRANRSTIDATRARGPVDASSAANDGETDALGARERWITARGIARRLDVER